MDGELLNYHWFAYADLAATSWATGIEPATLLIRLFFVPLLAATPFAVASLARQVTGRWWPGPVAALLAFAGVAPYPYSWPMPETYRANGLGPVDDAFLLRFGLFSSPTQTFAALVAIAVVMLVIDVLRREGSRRTLIGLSAAVAVVCGAKATYLPIIVCGLLLAVALALVTDRRRLRPALTALAIAVPGMLFAQFVLFGGESQGMKLDPLAALSRYGLAAATGLGAFPIGKMPATGKALILITAVTLLAWLAMWGGAGALLFRSRWRDPALQLLVGMGAAAFAMVLLFNHSGLSQSWFLVAARPYLAVAAVAGLAALASRASGRLLALAGCAGLVLAAVVPLFGPAEAPTVRADGRREVFLQIGYAHLRLLLPVLVAVLLVALAGRRRTPRRTPAAAVAIALLAGAGLYPSIVVVANHVRDAAAIRFAPEPQMASLWPAGAREAAGWMKANTDPSELVATNAHCRRTFPNGACDNLHFWFAAFAERRFLVEGWGYTATANRIHARVGGPGNLLPFWDATLLAENDAVFHQPSAAAADRLRTGRDVRWLFVDRRDPALREDLLARHATLRFRSGSVSIYQL